MIDRLELLTNRYNEINEELLNPEVLSNFRIIKGEIFLTQENKYLIPVNFITSKVLMTYASSESEAVEKVKTNNKSWWNNS